MCTENPGNNSAEWTKFELYYASLHAQIYTAYLITDFDWGSFFGREFARVCLGSSESREAAAPCRQLEIVLGYLETD